MSYTCNEDCPKCGYPTKQMSKGLYQVGQPCPECGYNAFGVEEGVSDLGRHRKMKKEWKDKVTQAFINMAHPGVPPLALAHMMARHAIGLLELPGHSTDDWYERPPPPEIETCLTAPTCVEEAQRMFGTNRGRRRCKK
jgi:hypothetical protein